ncbi:hypothetical protein KSF_077220 [Reticulibacter mediterranei]|uniref:Uncharacterized protein n=1 Tax=Reticulibacter mediterranei TaxID=2778369 RepID=A0A8J3N440_9CHLR|nr:hypothetical protein [Reticulibacter mediterranei]GHO97674.1 hypothetical protein KSF_077220 [Reticulibacter mediterranei]
MATKKTEMYTIDLDSLDVEELEERLELAAMFANKPASIDGEQGVASAYDDPSCWAHWHDGCSF